MPGSAACPVLRAMSATSSRGLPPIDTATRGSCCSRKKRAGRIILRTPISRATSATHSPKRATSPCATIKFS